VGYRRWRERSTGTRAGDFVLDAVLLPSPYAYSFGTFFGVATSAWLAAGSVLASASQWASERRGRRGGNELPPDMSTVSLVGGGLIAGDALAALGLGIVSLMAMLV
jgi:hypothetical protein